MPTIKVVKPAVDLSQTERKPKKQNIQTPKKEATTSQKRAESNQPPKSPRFYDQIKDLKPSPIKKQKQSIKQSQKPKQA